MKSITPQQIEGVIETVLTEKEKLAGLKGEPFNGISNSELISGITGKIGTDWILKKQEPFKVSKEDISAIANNRFFRKIGMRMLMILAIVVLGLATLTTTVRIIPPFVYYGLEIISAIVFLYFYTKKQRDFRRELRKSLEASGIVWGG